MDKTFEHQIRVVSEGVSEIIPKQLFYDKLKKSITQGIPLRIKLGFDPTSPDIHIGHSIVLRKLKQFQNFGHHIIIVIGDFTGRIGDPTGKLDTRKQLSEEKIMLNSKTYKDQIFKLLDPDKTEITFNSNWLSTMNFNDILKLSSKYTVARMLERDDFSKRFKNGHAISIHEFFYPLMQGYDSVILKADIEFGGTDQTFNLLMGRHLQKEYNQEPQVIMTMPLLEGTDGVNKMSKSLGNHVGIYENPNEMYGKIMSIPDSLILKYYELVTDIDAKELFRITVGYTKNLIHPRDLKMRLAYTIIRMYHGEEIAQSAQDTFVQIFQKNFLPPEISEIILNYPEGSIVWLPKLLCELGLTSSNGDAKRLISQGAIKINNKKYFSTDYNLVINSKMIFQVGKRKFKKLILN